MVYEQLPRTANGQRAEFVRRTEDLVRAALPGPLRAIGGSVAWILMRSIEAVTVGYVP